MNFLNTAACQSRSLIRAACRLTLLPAVLLLAGSLPVLAQGLPAANEAQLLATLKSDAPRKEKADACLVLARIATKESVPVLAAMLADADFNHMARYVLETLPDPAADTDLLEAARKLSGLPLVGVLGSLGVRHSPGADQVLPGYLTNSDPLVAEAAARALGRLATPAAIRSLQAALTKVPATQQLAVCEGLFRSAESLSAQGKSQEAAALYDQLRSLATAPHQVRAGALRGAILARGAGGVPLLIEGLRGDDFVLVDAAIRTVLELPGTEAIPALSTELPELPTDQQILVVQTLAWRKDPAALPALAAAARGGELTVRVAAVRGIAQMACAGAAPVLAGLLTDPEKSVAQAAQEGLASLPGAEAEAAVLGLLGDPDAARRLLALELLGRRRATSAMPAIWKCTADADERVRASALRRISELAGPDDFPKLLDLLAQTTSPQDLEAIGQAIGRSAERSPEPARAVEAMAGRFPALKPAQQAALLGALGAVGGGQALGQVRQAMQNPDESVRSAALAALAEWKSFDAAPDLLALATGASNPEVAAVAFSGCVRLCAESDAPADQRLKTLAGLEGVARNANQKKRLLSALGEVPTVPALQLVAKYVSEPALANEAGAAAVKICSKLDASSQAEAAPVLNQVVKSAKAKPVLDGARKQLGRLGIKAE
jgi:HEAT repeat protein